jgi:hypothetical protein
LGLPTVAAGIEQHACGCATLYKYFYVIEEFGCLPVFAATFQ